MSSAPKQHKHDDPTGTGEKHRYECPAGHKSWERINNHVWCHGCSQELHGDSEADPEWQVLIDTTTGEEREVPELVEEWPDFQEVPAY